VVDEGRGVTGDQYAPARRLVVDRHLGSRARSTWAHCMPDGRMMRCPVRRRHASPRWHHPCGAVVRGGLGVVVRGERLDAPRGAPLLQGFTEADGVRFAPGFRQEEQSDGGVVRRRLSRAFAGLPRRWSRRWVETLLKALGGYVAELHSGGIGDHGPVVGPQPEVGHEPVVVHQLEGDQAVSTKWDSAVEPQRRDAPRQDASVGHASCAQDGPRDGLETGVERDGMAAVGSPAANTTAQKPGGLRIMLGVRAVYDS